MTDKTEKPGHGVLPVEPQPAAHEKSIGEKNDEEVANLRDELPLDTPRSVPPTLANRFTMRCPRCDRGENNKDAGGNEKCFHCGKCGFVECVWSSPEQPNWAVETVPVVPPQSLSAHDWMISRGILDTTKYSGTKIAELIESYVQYCRQKGNPNGTENEVSRSNVVSGERTVLDRDGNGPGGSAGNVARTERGQLLREDSAKRDVSVVPQGAEPMTAAALWKNWRPKHWTGEELILAGVTLELADRMDLEVAEFAEAYHAAASQAALDKANGRRMDIVLDEHCLDVIESLTPAGGEEIYFGTGAAVGGVKLLWRGESRAELKAKNEILQDAANGLADMLKKAERERDQAREALRRIRDSDAARPFLIAMAHAAVPPSEDAPRFADGLCNKHGEYDARYLRCPKCEEEIGTGSAEDAPATPQPQPAKGETNVRLQDTGEPQFREADIARTDLWGWNGTRDVAGHNSVSSGSAKVGDTVPEIAAEPAAQPAGKQKEGLE